MGQRLLIIIICIFPFRTVYGQSWKELLDRADSLYQEFNYDSAILLGTQALDGAQQAFGNEDTVVALILYRLGTYYFDYRKYAEAETYLNQSLTIRKKLLGDDHADVASTLYSLGAIYLRKGEYEKSEPFFQEALAIRERVFGPEHPEVARSLYGLTSLRNRQERYAEAESLGRRAISILEDTLGSHDTALVTPLIILGDLYHRTGRYADAASQFERAVNISTTSLDSTHPQVARSMTGLAAVYYSMGRYAEAEPLYEQALHAHEEEFGRYHQLVAIDLTNLGLLYAAQGKLDAAEEIYLQALEIFEHSLGMFHPFVMSCHSFLAELYLQMGQYDEAESSLREALNIAVKRFGPEHSETAVILNGLANVWLSQKHYGTAETLYDSALTILKKSVGLEHPYVLQSLNGLASCYSGQRRYAEATQLFDSAVQLGEKVYGFDHPEVANTLELFGRHCRLSDMPVKGLELVERAFGIRKRNFALGAEVMSERDALIYAQFAHTSADQYLTAFLERRDFDHVSDKKAAGVILAIKGQVSDGIFARQMALVRETDPTTLALADSLRFIKYRLSKLFVEGPLDQGESSRPILDSLSSLANEVEAELARHSASYRKQQDYQDVTFERLASLIPENAALVEYLKFNYYQLDPDSIVPHYLVVVVTRDQEPVIVDLGDAVEVDAIVQRYREHVLRVAYSGIMPSVVDRQDYRKICVGDDKESDAKDEHQGLYGKIWRPIEKYVAGKDLVLIAPDGALNRVSFAGLMNGDGAYLIEQFAFHYLSAGRDLIRLQYQDEPGRGLFALGDPDYTSSALLHPSEPAPVVSAPVQSVTPSDCAGLLYATLDSLPGTRTEIELIKRRWMQISDEPVTECLDTNASETRFRAEAPGHRVIHLATHGYFCDPELFALPQRGFGTEQTFVGLNPLLLSGLFLAGANLHNQRVSSAPDEDGILTAYEVSAMDLHGTELVVLSACETGLGEVQSGEGVYGLRRAFQMAGARTVISALWPVPDEVTADMMSQLYDKRDESLPQLLRKIQLRTIKQFRAQGEVDHPFTWGAFIAVGDWR
jgi:CHAT domain-containing protein/Tfp pilus assembly protein PilF